MSFLRGIILTLAVLSTGAALVVLIGDWQADTLRPLGQVWYELSVETLNGFQVIVERYVWAPLWEPVQWVLEQTAFGFFAILALLLVGIYTLLQTRARAR